MWFDIVVMRDNNYSNETNNAPEGKTMKSRDRPYAANGLTSYRCKTPYGYVMIGAKDHDDAMREAARSSDHCKREDLEVWDGSRYIPC